MIQNELKTKVKKEEVMGETINAKTRFGAAARLTCSDCGHRVNSIDDWVWGMDRAASKQDPDGEHDSGVFACPECSTIQDHTLLDDFVKWDSKTGITAQIPIEIIDLVLELEPEEAGARFNLGQAILNAVKSQIMQRFGERASLMFPKDYE